MVKNYQADREKLFLAKSIMEQKYREALNAEKLACLIGMNSEDFSRGFRWIFNKHPDKFLKDIRIGKAKALLESTIFTIDQISKWVGIPKSSDLVKQFKRVTGVTPRKWRQEKIRCGEVVHVKGDGRLIILTQ